MRDKTIVLFYFIFDK